MDYDQDIVDALDATTSLTKGTDLFMGAVRGFSNLIPYKCVFVTASGGGPTRPIKAGLSGVGIQERHASAQIRIRSDAEAVSGSFSVGQSLAREVFDALHFKPVAGYCEWRAVSSAPLYIGQNEEGQHEWSINLDVIFDI